MIKGAPLCSIYIFLLYCFGRFTDCYSHSHNHRRSRNSPTKKLLALNRQLISSTRSFAVWGWLFQKSRGDRISFRVTLRPASSLLSNGCRRQRTNTDCQMEVDMNDKQRTSSNVKHTPFNWLRMTSDLDLRRWPQTSDDKQLILSNAT